MIPYGIDLETFAPGDRAEARRALSLPTDVAVLVFAANGIRKNPWRDYGALRTALEALQLGETPIICLALGDEADTEELGNAEVRFVPFVNDPADVARHYHAADVYVHPSVVDTFPNSVLEALACGLPVVATRVGAIPEEVDEELAGLLVPPRDPSSLRAALERVLVDDERRQRLGRSAAEEAQRRFSLTREIDDHLDLFASARDAFDRVARGG